MWIAASSAVAVDFADITAISDLNFGMWQAGGSLTATSSSCVASADTANPNPPRNANHYPYNIKIESLNGSSLVLYKDGNSANTGDAVVAVEFEHRDVIAQTAYEILAAGVYDGHAHNGLFKNCTGSVDNSEFRITLYQSELEQKQSGIYQGQFRATIIGGQSGTATDFEDFQISLEIVNSTSNSVRISRLDNAVFAPFSGLGDRSWDERFCVYSDAASGAYRITVTGQHQDASAGFRLKNTAQEEYIPLAVAFADSGTGTATTPVGSGSISGFGSTSAEDCGGTDNATLSFSITEQNMSAASSGFYNETIVLVVEPE
jgi:hypothetical protein